MESKNDLWEIERGLRAKGFETICGADEAGAGPLAGPVYAAAVILPWELHIEGLNDSKKLTPKKRDALFDIIKDRAVAWAVASVDEKEIDRINILKARMKAMDEAIKALTFRPDMALIDGNRNSGIEAENITVIGGDGKSANIAAASVLAKVSRDRFMLEMDKAYPQYMFAKHKGYGTKLHYEMLDKYGPSPIHRRSFLATWEAGKHG